MIQTGVTTAHSHQLAEGLTDYFLCEFPGDPSRECDREVFTRYTHPYLLVVTYILLGFIPLTILNFVVNVKSTKAFLLKHLSVCRGRGVASVTISNGASTSSSGVGSVPNHSITTTTSFAKD